MSNHYKNRRYNPFSARALSSVSNHLQIKTSRYDDSNINKVTKLTTKQIADKAQKTMLTSYKYAETVTELGKTRRMLIQIDLNN
jgi:hypothetical protein